jgi:hypothetical protein
LYLLFLLLASFATPMHSFSCLLCCLFHQQHKLVSVWNSETIADHQHLIPKCRFHWCFQHLQILWTHREVHSGGLLCSKCWWEITTTDCLITQKSAVFGYFAVEAWKHAYWTQHKCQIELLWNEQQWSITKVHSFNSWCKFCVYFLCPHLQKYFQKTTSHTWYSICFCNTIPSDRAFFLGGCRGTRTPKHFVNLTGESKNFKCWNSR